MRRTGGWVLFAVLLLAACGSSGSDKATSTSSVPSTTVDATTSSAASTTTAPPVTSTTPVVTSTTASAPTCPPAAGSTSPYVPSAAANGANVLRAVGAKGKSCRDVVTFTFRPSSGAPPLCAVAYKSGPFTEDASGAPVTVAGTAFLAVRCSPARTIDFLTNETTYTPPANRHTVPVGTEHVVDLVETGDSEGVMTWVIGLDAQLPFRAVASANGVFAVNVLF